MKISCRLWKKADAAGGYKPKPWNGFGGADATALMISAIYIEASGITLTVLTTAFADRYMPKSEKAIAFAAKCMPECFSYMPESALYSADT